MTTTTLHSIHLPEVGRGSAVVHALRNTASALREWNARREAIRELYALSDRQLTDIGLVRAEIRSTVDKLIVR